MKLKTMMNTKIGNACRSKRWVELDIFSKYLGKTRLRQVSQLKDIIDIIKAGWSDLDWERVDQERLRRTGVKLPESGAPSEDADYVLGDLLNGLNLGDDKITIKPTSSRKFTCFIHGKQVA